MAARADLEQDAPQQRLWPLLVTDDRLVSSVRRGEEQAFDLLYERHSAELLAFCRGMLGSTHDAEDALQATFAAAHRALMSDRREIDIRPWLYAIARNASLSIIRRRRPVSGETDSVPALHSDPVVRAEQRQEVLEVLGNVLELPQRQRDALVMAELHGLRHAEVGAAMGVRPEQVKAYVHQARVNLIAEREARTTDCLTIRRQLDEARGAARRKAKIRRHLRSCPGCRAYAGRQSDGRRGLLGLLPLPGLLSLHRRALGALLPRHGLAPPAARSPLAAQVAELGGGGGLAMAAKVLVGIVLLGAGAKVGTSAVEHVRSSPGVAQGHDVAPLSRAPLGPGGRRAALSASPTAARTRGGGGSPSNRLGTGGTTGAGILRKDAGVLGPHAAGGSSVAASNRSAPVTESPGAKAHGGGLPGGKASEVQHPGKEAHGRSEEAPGKSEAPRGKSEEAPGKSEAPHGRSEEAPGKSEAPHGRSEKAPGKSEAPHGRSEEAPGKSEAPHGRSEEAPGKSEAPRGKSEEAPGKSEAPRGRSEEAPGKSEAPRGGSEETAPHGKSEEAPGHGREAPHGSS